MRTRALPAFTCEIAYMTHTEACFDQMYALSGLAHRIFNVVVLSERVQGTLH